VPLNVIQGQAKGAQNAKKLAYEEARSRPGWQHADEAARRNLAPARWEAAGSEAERIGSRDMHKCEEYSALRWRQASEECVNCRNSGAIPRFRCDISEACRPLSPSVTANSTAN